MQLISAGCVPGRASRQGTGMAGVGQAIFDLKLKGQKVRNIQWKKRKHVQHRVLV